MATSKKTEPQQPVTDSHLLDMFAAQAFAATLALELRPSTDRTIAYARAAASAYEAARALLAARELNQ